MSQQLASVSTATAVTESGRQSDTPTVLVEFRVPAAVGGIFADVIAEFMSWVPLPMDPQPDGSFHARLRLPTGRCWRYQFLIDGERWVNDWDADDYVVDDDGCGMSLLRT